MSSPAIGPDGTVYVGSYDEKLYAINGKRGVKLWEFKTGHWVSSSPAIGSDGTVYVGSHDKKLYAINGKSGDKLWEFVTGSAVSSLAIGSDGTVYVGSFDNKLYAIKTASQGLAKSPWPCKARMLDARVVHCRNRPPSTKPSKACLYCSMRVYFALSSGVTTGNRSITSCSMRAGLRVSRFTYAHRVEASRILFSSAGRWTTVRRTAVVRVMPEIHVAMRRSSPTKHSPR